MIVSEKEFQDNLLQIARTQLLVTTFRLEKKVWDEINLISMWTLLWYKIDNQVLNPTLESLGVKTKPVTKKKVHRQVKSVFDNAERLKRISIGQLLKKEEDT